MKDFIFTWYKEILFCVSVVIEFVFFIVALIKKSKKQTPITLDLLELVPKYIAAAEKILGSGKGEKKRDFVLDELSKIFFNYTGHSMDEATFKFLSKAIEEILSTPQKKEKI